MGRLPANQRCKRHKQRPKRCEEPQPGHKVQIDVKSVAPIAGVAAKRHYQFTAIDALGPRGQGYGIAAAKRHYQFTAIDGCTRIRVRRVYPKCNRTTAVQFLDYVLERLPFRVEAIQTDNGAEPQSGLSRPLGVAVDERSRPTTAPSPSRASAGTSWTGASATAAPSRPPRG